MVKPIRIDPAKDRVCGSGCWERKRFTKLRLGKNMGESRFAGKEDEAMATAYRAGPCKR